MANNRAKNGLLLLVLLTLFAACTGRETVEGLKIYPAGKEYYSQALSIALAMPFDYIIEEQSGELHLKQAGGDAYINENYSVTIQTLPGESSPFEQLERVMSAQLEPAEEYEERSILQPINTVPTAGVEGLEATLITVFKLNNEYITTKFLLLKGETATYLLTFTAYNRITPDFNSDFELLRKSIKLK